MVDMTLNRNWRNAAERIADRLAGMEPAEDTPPTRKLRAGDRVRVTQLEHPNVGRTYILTKVSRKHEQVHGVQVWPASTDTTPTVMAIQAVEWFDDLPHHTLMHYSQLRIWIDENQAERQAAREAERREQRQVEREQRAAEQAKWNDATPVVVRRDDNLYSSEIEIVRDPASGNRDANRVMVYAESTWGDPDAPKLYGVNWSACGTRSVAEARAYARAILFAADEAERMAAVAASQQAERGTV